MFGTAGDNVHAGPVFFCVSLSFNAGLSSNTHLATLSLPCVKNAYQLLSHPPSPPGPAAKPDFYFPTDIFALPCPALLPSLSWPLYKTCTRQRHFDETRKPQSLTTKHTSRVLSSIRPSFLVRQRIVGLVFCSLLYPARKLSYLLCGSEGDRAARLTGSHKLFQVSRSGQQRLQTRGKTGGNCTEFRISFCHRCSDGIDFWYWSAFSEPE